MTDATMILNPDGTAADASPSALALLGVTLEQLRSLPPGAFAPEPGDPETDAAFREAWEEQGSPDIGGEATIRRLDGTRLRVRFAIRPIPDGRFRAILEPTPGAVEQAPKIFTAGETLAAWRAAERRLAELPPETPEWSMVKDQIAGFRSRYQEMFKAKR